MELRKQLDKIIQDNSDKNWWSDELFQEKVLPLLPKELEVLEFPSSKDKNYNCFIYTLGLSMDTNIIKDAGGFIYDIFLQKLIDEKILIYTEHPQDGDYILYKNPREYPGIITHSGVLNKGKVISKWAWGPLLRHGIFDVPASYGSDISYIKAITPKKAKELYWGFKEFNKLP